MPQQAKNKNKFNNNPAKKAQHDHSESTDFSTSLPNNKTENNQTKDTPLTFFNKGKQPELPILSSATMLKMKVTILLKTY
ncbi:6747_t:CDS:2 [Funneliformis geosporum]|nr:6747_t:CDS:2 [Funneliformis geosporum]